MIQGVKAHIQEAHTLYVCQTGNRQPCQTRHMRRERELLGRGKMRGRKIDMDLNIDHDL